MAFHKSQIEAIHHFEGPMMVLAGPGSGKTTVITHRVKYLIEECGVNPSSILVITFTRAAAEEMRQRFWKLMETSPEGMESEKTGANVQEQNRAGGGGMAHPPVNFGTFHAVFFNILRYAYRYDASNIVREEERVEIIRKMIEKMHLEVEDEKEFIASILSEIGVVKGEMMSLDYYYSKNCSEEIFRRLYQGYQSELERSGKIDFEDMLVMCYELFTQRKDILSAWQRKFRFILIDEFQDINRVQYEIVKMLALPENNLFIVGDDDQSIYRFRGAKPEIMLGFEKDYPQSRQVLLGINYRSTKEIVDASERLIAHNKTRYPKEIRANRGAGHPVVTEGWSDAQAETRGIVQEIQNYVRMGYQLSDIAVLYRTSMEPRLLMERLMEYNIPFQMRDALPNLYEHWIAKDFLSYLRIGHSELCARRKAKREDALRIVNRPKRYISREALEGSVISWDQVENWYQDRDWMMERIDDLCSDLKMIGRMAPAPAINYIRKAVGYDEYLREYAEFRRMNPEELFEVADQIQESAAGYQTLGDWETHQREYAEKLREQGQRLGREAGQRIDCVTLMTMHSSKGLEFPIVYILDANERITPHHKAVLEADLEEERRMFYVAMTRAKDRLHVCFARQRYGKQQEPSRFIQEYRKAETGKPDKRKAADKLD
ncbi:ATP-dependent helicase [Brotaphodocola sp.]|uniref:ATP-dependent helicase n=1 Tax=Brotaphodocola sp. TaxID=3073577 RepID=UPI003D7CDD7C